MGIDIKIASRSVFYDETGKRVRTKKEITGEDGKIRPGCTVIKKGEVYEQHMPKEFAKLQAQDLGKIGAMQDLLRGIGKIIGNVETPKTSVHSYEQQMFPNNNSSLLKRGYMALEDEDWSRAAEFSRKH